MIVGGVSSGLSFWTAPGRAAEDPLLPLPVDEIELELNPPREDEDDVLPLGICGRCDKPGNGRCGVCWGSGNMMAPVLHHALEEADKVEFPPPAEEKKEDEKKPEEPPTMRLFRKCSMCNGSGRCYFCSGTGQL
jgi:hypothetical protein